MIDASELGWLRGYQYVFHGYDCWTSSLQLHCFPYVHITCSLLLYVMT